MEEEKDEHVASLAHEIKHKYDKQSKQFGLIGQDAEYQATQRRGSFGIPVIDKVFFRYLYYISGIENLVRPTEVAYKLKRKNITKSQFKEFLFFFLALKNEKKKIFSSSFYVASAHV